MIKDILPVTPLMTLPLLALFLFVVVFVAVSVRAMTRSRQEIEALARLPLSGGGKES